MNSRRAWILAFTLGCVACEADVEESRKFYRDSDHASFVARLEAANIRFRIASDGQVFYPVSERETVNRISEEITGPVDRTIMGMTVAVEHAPEVSRKLSESGVSFREDATEDGVLFTWAAVENKRATAITISIIR